MVIFTIICSHCSSLRYTHIKEKEIPGVSLIFTVKTRSLNPKLKQLVHLVVLHPSSGVDTVNLRNHLNEVFLSRQTKISKADYTV